MYTPFTHREATQLHTKSLWLEINPNVKPILDTPTKAELHITNTIAPVKHQSIHILFLTPRNHLIKNLKVWRGSFNGARFGGTNLLKACKELNAARIIMVHHNPTGTIQITERHKAVLSFTQITLKLMSMRVDDLFLTGRYLPNANTPQTDISNNSINNPANHFANIAADDQPVTIVSMAQQGLVPEIDVTSDSRLGQ